MSATISSKHQVVIPRDAREKLGLKPGDKVEFVVRDGSMIVFPTPKSWEKALRGIAKGMYPPDYIEKERQSWD